MWACRKFLILIWVYVEVQGAGVDWCSKDLECEGHKNSMCFYKPQTNIGNCTNIQINQTPYGRKQMMELHNEYRNRLAGGGMPGWPKAANMRQLSYDCEIELVATRWGVQCQRGHDKCRSTPKFKHCGQNYGFRFSTGEFPESIDGHFKGWSDREIGWIKDPPSMIDSYVSGEWGHFTAVIWATTYKIGCGNIRTIKNGNEKTVILVCNYGPGGNIEGGKVYLTGEPASKCPDGTGPSKKYPNLCTEVKKVRYYADTNVTEPEFDCRAPGAAGTLQRDILVILAVGLFLN